MPTTPKGITYPSNSSPVAVPADIQQAAEDVDGMIVPSTGGTYTGSVSFTQSPSVPTPTSGLHATNKTYVDDLSNVYAPRDIGNLLTDEAANTSDRTAFTCYQLTAWLSSIDSGVLRITKLADSSASVRAGTGGTASSGSTVMASGTIPVTPGETYAFMSEVRSSAGIGGTALTPRIYWWTSAGDVAASTTVSDGTAVAHSAAWKVGTVTAVAPANAAFASVSWRASSGVTGLTGEYIEFKRWSLHRGTGGEWAMPGYPIQGLEIESQKKSYLAEVGNLVLENVASGTDALGDVTGWTSTGATLESSTDFAYSGTRSAKYTPTAAGSSARAFFGGLTNVGTLPVVGGMQHTFTFRVRPAAGLVNRQLTAIVYWWQSNGTTAASPASTSFPVYTLADGSWLKVQETTVAPSNAAFASVRISGVNGYLDIGEAFYLDEAGWWLGAGGQWQLPYAPITGQSHIAINNAVHLSGTGSPESKITAAPGSTYLQTDATNDVKGWIRWIKSTGTGNTGWIAGPEADTGWRNVSADYMNGWTTYGGYNLVIRRVNNTVYLQGYLNGGTADDVYTLPSGFRAYSTYGPCGSWVKSSGSPSGVVRTSSGYGVKVVGATGVTTLFMSMTFATSHPWPSSLPGSAA